MGCDIHAHFEFKADGRWHHYSHPQIHRSYELFAKMAGVRKGDDDDIEVIAEPRGLPDDITFTTRFDEKEEGTDAHSHSWLGAEELRHLEIWWDRRHREEGVSCSLHYPDGLNLGYFFGNDYGDPSEWPKGVEDVRCVFWFDN